MMTGATRRFGIAKALAVGLCLILAGCDTTSVDPSDSKQTNPKAQTADGGSTTVASYSGDGLSVKDVGEDESTMLAFEDTTAVKKYMSHLQDQNDLAAVEQQYSGFTSMRAWLEKKKEEAEERRETADLSDSTNYSRDEFVSSDFPASDEFLSMMNAGGKVQIGNRIFKITEDYVYEADVGEEALLDDVDGSQSQHAELTVHETQHGTSDPSQNGPEDDSCEIYATNSDYRMQGRIEYHNYWFFSEALVQTRWQEKQSFLWWEWWENVGNSDFYHNWDGIVWESGPSGGYEETVVGSEDEGSGAQLENQIYWTFGFGVLVGGDVSGYHEIDNSTLSTNCSTQT